MQDGPSTRLASRQVGCPDRRHLFNLLACGAVGFVVGGGISWGWFTASTEAEPESDPPDPTGSTTPVSAELAWARERATGADAELLADGVSFVAACSRYPNDDRVLSGLDRLVELVLAAEFGTPESRRRVAIALTQVIGVTVEQRFGTDTSTLLRNIATDR